MGRVSFAPGSLRYPVLKDMASTGFKSGHLAGADQEVGLCFIGF